MFQFGFIKGISLGIEYDAHPDLGFVINCDLVIFRVTFFKDLMFED